MRAFITPAISLTVANCELSYPSSEVIGETSYLDAPLFLPVARLMCQLVRVKMVWRLMNGKTRCKDGVYEEVEKSEYRGRVNK